jgi:hypothetical protein
VCKRILLVDDDLCLLESLTLGDAIRQAIEAAISEGHPGLACDLQAILLDVSPEHGGEVRH